MFKWKWRRWLRRNTCWRAVQETQKGQKGRRGQWPEHLADDLAGIILDDDKYKEKLLLTNVKNIKIGQYYDKVIEELKDVAKEQKNFSSTLHKPGRSLNVVLTS